MGPSETDRLQIAKLARNYAVMIWRSFRQGQHQEAKDNFRQFLKLRVYTETAPFLTMMKVYNATKEHYKALEVWKILKNTGLPLDFKCHALHVKTLVFLLPGKDIHTFLGHLKEANIDPDLTVYNTILAALVKTDNYEAGKLFTEIDQSFGASKETYMHLISFFAKAKELEEIPKIWNAMTQQDLHKNVLAYNCILGVYLKEKRWTEFDRLYSEMRSDKVQPNIDTHNIILASHLQRKNFEQLFLLWQRLKRRGPGPNTVTCNTVMKAYTWTRQFHEIPKLFEQMKKNGVFQCHISYYYLLKAHMWLGEVDKVKDAYDKASKLRMSVNNPFFTALMQSWEHIPDTFGRGKSRTETRTKDADEIERMGKQERYGSKVRRGAAVRPRSGEDKEEAGYRKPRMPEVRVNTIAQRNGPETEETEPKQDTEESSLDALVADTIRKKELAKLIKTKSLGQNAVLE